MFVFNSPCPAIGKFTTEAQSCFLNRPNMNEVNKLCVLRVSVVIKQEFNGPSFLCVVLFNAKALRAQRLVEIILKISSKMLAISIKTYVQLSQRI